MQNVTAHGRSLESATWLFFLFGIIKSSACTSVWDGATASHPHFMDEEPDTRGEVRSAAGASGVCACNLPSAPRYFWLGSPLPLASHLPGSGPQGLLRPVNTGGCHSLNLQAAWFPAPVLLGCFHLSFRIPAALPLLSGARPTRERSPQPMRTERGSFRF